MALVYCTLAVLKFICTNFDNFLKKLSGIKFKILEEELLKTWVDWPPAGLRKGIVDYLGKKGLFCF